MHNDIDMVLKEHQFLPLSINRQTKLSTSQIFRKDH